MRSMWKGAVSFGLVMIPVKLYAATEQKDIAFRQVHQKDGGRIRFRRFCSIEDIEVPYEDIAKGYELPGGEVVVLSEDDMADLPLPTTRNIEVVQFCPAEQVDPIMFNRSYYAEPETAGGRAYVLLRDAMEQSGKVAIAKVALRQRESLAVLRVREGVLVLETLLWPDEVRETEFPFLDDDIDVRPQELRMASSLIESMTVDFDPDEYHDNYREALQEVVNAKIEGREILQPEPGEEAVSQPSSLADALRASLAAAKGGGKLSIAGAEGAEEEEEAEEEAEQPARRRGAKAGTAKAGTARAGTARAGTAKAGTAKASTAKPAPAKSGASATAAGPKAAAASKTATKTTAARGKSAAKEPESAARPRKRAG
jgi:DNA end-binding protein Ku